MMRILFVFCICSIFFEITISCKKEAKCDCNSDTTRVAKIFQPDNLPGKDAVIENIAPDQNSGDTPFLAAFSWTNQGFFDVARALVEFDLSSIPSQTKIKSANLSLYWNSHNTLTDQTGENAFSIYLINQEWDEHTVTWNNQPTTSDTAKVSIPKSSSANQSYLNIDVTALTQYMIDNPTAGHGFMLKLDNETPYALVILASSDCTDASKRPKLTVYY